MNGGVWVKICGLTTSDDVERAVEAGADGIGVVLESGFPCSVSMAKARELLDAMRGGDVMSLAVVGKGPPSCLTEASSLGFDAVQWAGPPGGGAVSANVAVLPVLFDGDDLEARVVAWQSELRLLAKTSCWPPSWPPRGLVNIDSAAGGGSGVRACWDRVSHVARRVPVMLAGGLSADNLIVALERVAPFAVDVSSGVESAPGRKDFAKMRDFVAVAHGA